MRQGKQIHQGYSFFWGVFLLLVMSAAISIHAEAPSTKELVLFKDTLKNDTIVPQSPKKNGTFVIRDRIPIPSDEPLFIVNGMELPYEIFAALNPAHIESLERCFSYCHLWHTWNKWGHYSEVENSTTGKGGKKH